LPFTLAVVLEDEIMKKSFAISVLGLLLASIIASCAPGGGVKGQGSHVEDSEHHESGHLGHRVDTPVTAADIRGERILRRSALDCRIEV
jgi:hypothetical protein